MRNLSAALLSILLLTATDAQAQTDNRNDVTLTIYQGPFSLVRDVRDIDLTRGVNDITLTDIPQSLQYASLLARFDGKMFNIEFDNTTPNYETFLRELVGKPIRLDHEHGSSIHGILLQYDHRLAIIKQADGSHVVLPNLNGYRVSTEEAPNFDEPYPKLKLSLEARRAGSQKLELYYLVPGMRWAAEYALILNDKETEGHLSGWTVVQNGSGVNFENAKVQLIAGEVNFGQKASGPNRQQFERMAMMAMESADASGPDAEQFADFQRYDLAGTHNLAQNREHRLALLDETTVKTTKKYRYTSTDRRMEFAEGGHVRVMFDIEQSGDNKKPLPAGSLKLYKNHGGQLQIIGGDEVRNIPAGGNLQITSGFAFDIMIQENPRAFNRVSDRIQEQINDIIVDNRRGEDITVEVERNINMGQRITTSSIPFEMISASRAIFKVPVKKGEKTTLEFTIRSER